MTTLSRELFFLKRNLKLLAKIKLGDYLWISMIQIRHDPHFITEKQGLPYVDLQLNLRDAKETCVSCPTILTLSNFYVDIEQSPQSKPREFGFMEPLS